MITIYHNPRCSKSRACNLMLEDFGEKVQVINYTKDLFTEKTLAEIIRLLKIKPLELVRKNEQEWKDNYKGKEMTDVEIIKAMEKNPKLIERPIVINERQGIIARPPEKVLSLFR